MSIYEEFGVTPIINVSGSVTRLGGAPMPDEVLKAFEEAARECVPLEELQGAASEFIAKTTGTDAGIVTAGAAAAGTLGAAAILTGYDLGKMEKLPHCCGISNEFVVAREQRQGYDHAIRAAGAKLVEVGFNEITANAGVRRTEAWEYEAAFGENTVGVLYVYGSGSRPPLKDVVEVAHRHALPVLVDAAGELPPKDNLKAIPATGADLVAFSGGKSIRGPQSTGILCGNRDLIASAMVQMLDMDDHPELWNPPKLVDKKLLGGIPRHGIGRGFKVSKEEIIALLAALRLFVSGEYENEIPAARSRLERIADKLCDCPAGCSIIEKPEALPLMEISIDETALGRSAMEICRRLRAGAPPIYVGHGELYAGKLSINPLHLDDQRAETLAKRLLEELNP